MYILYIKTGLLTMNDSTKEMCDSIKVVKTNSFSELEGSENISIDSSWTRRLVSPWGLFFPIEGTGNIALEDEVVPAPKGTFFVYKPGYRYTFRSFGLWRYLWFHYPVREHMIGQMDFDEVIPGLGMWTPEKETWNRIFAELREAVALERVHQPGWEALALLLVEVVLQRFAGIGHSGVKRSHDRIRHAVRLLTGEKNYRIGEIAAKCGISVPLLFQIFKREMGCSPREYREEFFLRQGKKMLLNTDLGIDEIAQACHMCDRYYFSNRFKRLFGVSPAAFRKGASR